LGVETKIMATATTSKRVGFLTVCDKKIAGKGREGSSFFTPNAGRERVKFKNQRSRRVIKGERLLHRSRGEERTASNEKKKAPRKEFKKIPSPGGTPASTQDVVELTVGKGKGTIGNVIVNSKKLRACADSTARKVPEGRKDFRRGPERTI